MAKRKRKKRRKKGKFPQERDYFFSLAWAPSSVVHGPCARKSASSFLTPMILRPPSSVVHCLLPSYLATCQGWRSLAPQSPLAPFLFKRDLPLSRDPEKTASVQHVSLPQLQGCHGASPQLLLFHLPSSRTRVSKFRRRPSNHSARSTSETPS